MSTQQPALGEGIAVPSVMLSAITGDGLWMETVMGKHSKWLENASDKSDNQRCRSPPSACLMSH